MGIKPFFHLAEDKKMKATNKNKNQDYYFLVVGSCGRDVKFEKIGNFDTRDEAVTATQIKITEYNPHGGVISVVSEFQKKKMTFMISNS